MGNNLGVENPDDVPFLETSMRVMPTGTKLDGPRSGEHRPASARGADVMAYLLSGRVVYQPFSALLESRPGIEDSGGRQNRLHNIGRMLARRPLAMMVVMPTLAASLRLMTAALVRMPPRPKEEDGKALALLSHHLSSHTIRG